MNNFASLEGSLAVPGFGEIYYQDHRPAIDRGLTPVLCLAGFWRNSSDFNRLAAKIAPERRVVAPDLRGRGKSSRSFNAADYHFDKLVADVWRLLDELTLPRVVVVGMALGGFIALHMARTKPDRIAGIVLNDVGTETASPGAKQIAAHMDHNTYTFDDALRKVRDQHGPYLSEFSEDDWRAFTLQAYRDIGGGRYVRDFDELTQRETERFKAAKPSFWDDYVSLGPIPVAILRGEFSGYLTLEMAKKMAAGHPRAILTTISGRSHWPMLDEEASLRAVGHLLAETDRPVGG
ncbi:alpha/beta hydrolase [Mesorhizobium sp. CU2]|uniref:alpha/beta fold hydrolase n=1 Tax=unclassified Mesorhizobium TaxID=325217 RepID=UPI0011297AC3|nr:MULTISPECIES: alpha/beta hydrolase [unclassified Mesorhizobium]TPN81117.1 alpha/beta hydrolase [Mesorhizobium sp. CU3]TPO17085.1 alpha/beta hydrolase [Mesorhizobium sp. CU2]